jgi:hypothetical protein
MRWRRSNADVGHPGLDHRGTPAAENAVACLSWQPDHDSYDTLVPGLREANARTRSRFPLRTMPPNHYLLRRVGCLALCCSGRGASEREMLGRKGRVTSLSAAMSVVKHGNARTGRAADRGAPVCRQWLLMARSGFLDAQCLTEHIF